eukprot:CAMPEP_0170520214 /NCGR_PEP_ID=MMETSP0209-20121228/5458_1 /TAXON_ID=665100 ORGANISM="Litonotus pictus, Strain P1" /NCGR_SAMPLE_ID=MMETSP0209 /ASSEMBLY_ACC=CAM_ASM_000301 /LENGTH=149 /DNA_ID=CAMNT_0010806379 /DNA_START=216 /DNA_END=661 /DNA_ORIENTATION=+
MREIDPIKDAIIFEFTRDDEFNLEKKIHFDMKVMYSEIYNCPVLYFHMFDYESNELIDWDSFLEFYKIAEKPSKKRKDLIRKSTLDNTPVESEGNESVDGSLDYFGSKNMAFEIQKTNFPVTGVVFYSLFLCNFCNFLNNIFEVNSLQP